VEQLRRYVAGQLPPAEEHTVEAHTLDCAMCADILEGLELPPAAAHEASLAALRQRLHTRVAELATEAAPAEPDVVPLWAWRPLAAAAVLLISLGLAAWLVLHRSAQRPEVAVRTTTAPAARPAPPTPEVAAATTTAPIPADLAFTPPNRPEPSPAVGLRARRRPLPMTNLRPETDKATPDLAAVNSASAGTASRAQSDEPGKQDSATDALAAAGRAQAAVAAAPEPIRTVQGRITDTAGQPLPGATVLVPGTQNGTSTDVDGKFQLNVPAATEQLAVSSIGYTTQTRALRPTDSTLALALAPDTQQLNEVVVVRREAPPMLPSVAAAPAGGYPALRKYLRDSLDYPQKAVDERLEGTVRLQFMVGADGKLSDFKVLRKVSPECDAEAIRLLQEGPAWFPAVQSNRRVARKVAVDVPFKIEQR
jgi:TonB family protein